MNSLDIRGGHSERFGFEFNNYYKAWGGGVAEHVGRFVNQPGNGLNTEQIYH